jgi:hypothetical protein
MATTEHNATAARVSTPWGAATVVERVVVPQRAADKRFSTVVELLETVKGEPLVRFAYSTDGVARRGPVTLRRRDLEQLRAALAEHRALGEILGLGAA